MKDVSELRLYTTDLDDFLTNQRNDILFTRVALSYFTELKYLKGIDSSVIDKRLHIDRSNFSYTLGTRVVPSIGRRHTCERADLEKPPHLRFYWPKEYEQRYPLIQGIRAISGSELRSIYERFSFLRTAEDRRVSNQLQRLEEEIIKVNEGRNPALKSLLNFLQSDEKE